MSYWNAFETAVGVSFLIFALRLHLAAFTRSDLGFLQEVITFLFTYSGVFLICLGLS